jgi:hypothetical protein
MNLQVAQVSFDSFVSRVRDAIARAMPDARATIVAPEAGRTLDRRDNRAQRPDDPAYDPHEAHYPNPMLGMLGMAMLGAAFMPSFGADAPSAESGGGGDASAGEGGDVAGDGGLFDFEW